MEAKYKNKIQVKTSLEVPQYQQFMFIAVLGTEKTPTAQGLVFRVPFTGPDTDPCLPCIQPFVTQQLCRHSLLQ